MAAIQSIVRVILTGVPIDLMLGNIIFSPKIKRSSSGIPAIKVIINVTIQMGVFVVSTNW